MKTNNWFLLTTVLLILIGSCQPKLQFEGGTWDFEQCIDFNGVILYKNYMIISNKEGNSFRFLVIDYYKNKVDSIFQNKLTENGISSLELQNDSLFGYSDTKKGYLYWNGKKWIDKKPFSNPHFDRFLETELYQSACYPVSEDDKYYMFAYSHGEFGAGIIFLNKENGISTGYPMLGISSIYSDSLG